MSSLRRIAPTSRGRDRHGPLFFRRWVLIVDEVKSTPDCLRAISSNKVSRETRNRARVGTAQPTRRGFSICQSLRKKAERDLVSLLSRTHYRSLPHQTGASRLTVMIAGNRRAGMFVIAFVLALFCLSLIAVLRTPWKTRQPMRQNSMTGQAYGPTFSYATKLENQNG
jgi:hypothetical protein